VGGEERSGCCISTLLCGKWGSAASSRMPAAALSVVVSSEMAAIHESNHKKMRKKQATDQWLDTTTGMLRAWHEDKDQPARIRAINLVLFASGNLCPPYECSCPMDSLINSCILNDSSSIWRNLASRFKSGTGFPKARSSIRRRKYLW
jgi:hypothetical protein